MTVGLNKYNQYRNNPKFLARSGFTLFAIPATSLHKLHILYG